jgi:hypothetical protein
LAGGARIIADTDGQLGHPRLMLPPLLLLLLLVVVLLLVVG